MAKGTAKRKPSKKPASRTRRKTTEALPAVDLGSEEDARVAVQRSLTPAVEVEAVDYANVGFLGKSWRDFKRTLREAAQWQVLRKTPYGFSPAVIFAVIGLVGSWNGRVLGLVLPEVVQDLDFNVSSLLTALNVTGFFFIFIAVGVSYFLDRLPRVPFVGYGTIAAGVGSILTPHAARVGTVAGSTLAADTGDIAAGIPNFSLLNDYYPPETRGRANAFVGTLARVGTLFAPWMVGLMAISWGWRWPFYITAAVLIAVGVVALIVLREPIRGYMERRAMGFSEEDSRRAEPPMSLGQAWRTIWGIRTIRRLFIGSIADGVGARIQSLLYVIFLFEEYGLDVLERGKLFTLTGVFAIVGGFIGGGVVDSLMRRRPQRVLVYSSIIYALEAVSFGIITFGPPLVILIILNAVFGFAIAMTGSARFVFYATLLPANIRTMGLGIFGLASVPAVILYQVFVSRLDDWGTGGVLFASAPFFLVSALIDLSAAGFFERDMRSAMSTQAASAEFRKSRDEGRIKLLVCRDVEVDYDGVQVLFGVDFDVDEGEIVALLGTNGAGKSTLLKAISGIQEASGGAIVFDGREITHVPGYEIAGRGIAHAPGGRGIFPSLTVRDNLELGKWLHSRTSDDAEDAIPNPLSDLDLDEVFDIFPVLKDRLGATGGSLSGGEQQMVSLAQAFLARPRLLLIDELSLGLSPAVVQELLDCVRRIHKRGVTIVVVEQSVNIALTIADRAVFMEKGEVKFSGPTRDLLRRPDILRAVYVKGTGALVSSAPDTARAEQRRRASLSSARAVLEVENLTRAFGGLLAVDDVSFTLSEGEVLGLIGPNGAGKTTIFDLISGFLKPDAGKVLYDGSDVTSMGPDERARLQLIRRFQDAKLFPALTVYETILIALDRRHQARNMVFAAVQAPQARQSERRLRTRADQLVELLELGAYRDKFVKELSTGLRRITDIACMLATEPKVLLLDEPSSGIAQAEAESLGPLLRRVRVETGCSILIIEHDMPLISRVADELLALDQGKVVLRGAPADVLNDKRVVESYLGTSEASIRRSGVLT